MASKTGPREKIMMMSTGLTEAGNPTGTFYTTEKNKRNTPDKLLRKRFDPLAWDTEKNKRGKHCEFKEKKIPK